MKNRKKLLVVSLSLLVIVAITLLIFTTVERDRRSVAKHRAEMADTYAVFTPATEQNILAEVNAERAKVGVAPLVLHPNITKSAQLKADDMLNRGYRTHFLPEDPNATLTAEMYSYIEPICSNSSENLMASKNDVVRTTEGLMYAWMNSEPHRNAILNPDYTYTGIASSSDNTILVQHFCVARTNQ